MTQRELEVLNWFSTLWPGPEVRASSWLFATGESLHFIGLCMLFGALIFVDLRLLGFYRRIPVKSVLAFLPYAVVGFTINAATGWLFFTSNPKMYWENIAFRVKLVLIVLAGLNALAFTVMEHREVAHLGPGQDTPRFTKITAGLSLTLWLGVLLIGRLLPIFTVGTN